jgi:hypothetical protein
LFLLIAYFANVVGGPPPSVRAVYTLGVLGGLMIVVWSWWTDRHRQTV